MTGRQDCVTGPQALGGQNPLLHVQFRGVELGGGFLTVAVLLVGEGVEVVVEEGAHFPSLGHLGSKYKVLFKTSGFNPKIPRVNPTITGVVENS